MDSFFLYRVYFKFATSRYRRIGKLITKFDWFYELTNGAVRQFALFRRAEQTTTSLEIKSRADSRETSPKEKERETRLSRAEGICIGNVTAYEMLFRWRRYDAAPGATVSAVLDVGEADGPADTFGIDVSITRIKLSHYRCTTGVCLSTSSFELSNILQYYRTASDFIDIYNSGVCTYCIFYTANRNARRILFRANSVSGILDWTRTVR